MKTFFYSLLLSTIFITPLWADSHEGEPTEAEHGIKIQIDMDDDIDEEGNEDSDVGKDENDDEDLETIIKGKVFPIIGEIIDAVADEMTEAEKEEIKLEIKKAIQEIDEVDGDDRGHSIHIDSDESSIFDDGLSFLEALIPLTAIVFTFGMPLLIVAVVLYFSYRKKRLMHDTIDQYVTSGKDIPPEVLKGLQKEITPKNNLHRGLVMSGIGLGIFACFAVIGSLNAAAFGLIPLFIGLAQLLIWKLENK